ncbi:MAG: sulfatase [Planctomycetota bacterium]
MTAAWFLLASMMLATDGAAEPRPNLVVLLVDDQRNDQLGCAGHPFVQTPHIDRLARRGVHFRNAFVTTSICAASRASIFTGLTERTHGYTFGQPPVGAGDVRESYPAELRRAGYRTMFIGKFGVSIEGDPRQTMFDDFRTIGRNPYFRPQADGSTRHETDLAIDWALESLAEAPDDRPFCLSISFNAVHAEDSDKVDHYPWPPGADGLYEDVPMPLPRLRDPAIFVAQPTFLKESLNRQRYFWRWDTPEKYERNLRAYYRMITGVDQAIGRLLDGLEREGHAENTVIVYLADNGYYMGERGFAGKWSHYEEALRIPLIVFDPRAPQERRGQVRDEMVLNLDVAPTLLELAGVPRPVRYQGRSLVPWLERRDVEGWRVETFCEHRMDHAALPKWEGIRGERYVYACYDEQEPPVELLYDLESDPDQLVNLAGNDDYAETLTSLRERTRRLASRYESARR